MQSNELRDEIEALRAALGGRHERLYLTSAQFHASINALANLLPAMVDGLASDACSSMADADRAMREMMERSTAIPIEPGSYVDQMMRRD